MPWYRGASRAPEPLPASCFVGQLGRDQIRAVSDRRGVGMPSGSRVPEITEELFTKHIMALPLETLISPRPGPIRTSKKLAYYKRRQCKRALVRETLHPFRTAVPFWGQTTQISSRLSIKRDSGSKGINKLNHVTAAKEKTNRRTQRDTQRREQGRGNEEIEANRQTAQPLYRTEKQKRSTVVSRHT